MLNIIMDFWILHKHMPKINRSLALTFLAFKCSLAGVRQGNNCVLGGRQARSVPNILPAGDHINYPMFWSSLIKIDPVGSFLFHLSGVFFFHSCNVIFWYHSAKSSVIKINSQEFPFFVVNQGWSSVCPPLTKLRWATFFVLYHIWQHWGKKYHMTKQEYQDNCLPCVSYFWFFSIFITWNIWQADAGLQATSSWRLLCGNSASK